MPFDSKKESFMHWIDSAENVARKCGSQRAWKTHWGGRREGSSSRKSSGGWGGHRESITLGKNTQRFRKAGRTLRESESGSGGAKNGKLLGRMAILGAGVSHQRPQGET